MVMAENNVLAPYGFAKKTLTLVTECDAARVRVLCCDETPAEAICEIQRLYGVPVDVVFGSREHVLSEQTKAYQQQSQNSLINIDNITNEVDLSQLVNDIPESEDLLDSEGGAPVIRLINALFAEALKAGASDIHIETYERSMSVRYRVDGRLQEVLTPARALSTLLVSRLKVMARLDIAEKRLPQDGRIQLALGGHKVDVRISTIPSSYGERVVMRVLDQQASRLSFDGLGMPEHCYHPFRDMLRQPHGIILVTGPTGSGKTTTLYAGLSLLNDRSRNVLTVEDPIEYALEDIGQTQVNPKVDMTFARGLRAILRQDPDVVMVGEIRDTETAEIAIQASLTGHLVLSTLHTNDAVGAVTRLEDLGVQPYLIASSLLGVLGQRLVRKLCPVCKQPHELPSSEAQRLHMPELAGRVVYQPGGCDNCLQTGYKGRIGIYELLQVTPTIRDLIHRSQGEQQIIEAARDSMSLMYTEGLKLVAEGVTSLEEVLRTVREDGDAII
jgi:general secretion pathway protein E